MTDMRPIAALVFLALSMLALPGGMVPARAQAAPACESQAGRGDRREVSCTLTPSGAGQRFRFRAHFSGSHDDTTASLTPTLDGSPLVCEAGSKTRLEGEDGDVNLECRFSTADKAGTKPVLRVLIAWHHAQYKDFELISE